MIATLGPPPTLHSLPLPTSRPAPTQTSPAALPAPSAPATPTAQPVIKDAAQLWAAFMREIVSRPWMSWAEALDLREWSGALVKVGAKTGRQDALKTISPQRRDQMATVLSKLLGRPMQVELVMPPPPAGPSGPMPGSPVNGMPSGPSGSTGTLPPGGRVSTKQQAMNLPLVRSVMDVFDATLIEFRANEAEAEIVETPVTEAPGEGSPQAPGWTAPPAAGRRPDFAGGDDDGESDDE